MSTKVVLLMCLVCVTVEGVWGSTINSDQCPGQGKVEHGYWKKEDEDGHARCILKCADGFIPDGCHILRKKSKSEWNHRTPTCVEEAWIYVPGRNFYIKTGIALGSGAAAVWALPGVLAWIGFSSAGVVAGSIAASVQGPSVAAGSLFAFLQSIGATGLSAWANGLLGSAISSLTAAASSLVGEGCELE